MRVELLDHGYIELVEAWGSDERIIEAARMSTAKGFLGWGPVACACLETETPGMVVANLPAGWIGEGHGDARTEYLPCPKCHGTSQVAGDEKLLAYLWNNKHATPFEMAGMTIEVQAPIFVFREWHRHRTQSYNELSARYTPLPNTNYRPSTERCIVVPGSKNKQATGTTSKIPTHEQVLTWLERLDYSYRISQEVYDGGLDIGIPKEVARIPVPVGRYSRMRASANLRNWLAFLTLRMAPAAQWEIRQYANAVGDLIAKKFPHTWELFNHDSPARAGR